MMKKLSTLLLMAGMFLVPAYLSAQEDITPDGYKFSQQPIGPFSLDKEFNGANPPASDPDVKDFWTVRDRFITVGNPNLHASMEFTSAQGKILNSFYQIVDMGGEVGKVLMMKGGGSEFPHGVAGDEGFWLGWWNKSFYTDPVLTPSVVGLVNQGLTQEEAEKEATVRFRVTFHIHQNVLSTSAKLFDILAYTYTGNHKIVNGVLTATQEFKSGDFADLAWNEEEETEVFTYNPNKWIVSEYDFRAPELDGAPLRFTFRMGGNAATTALLIKSIEIIANPQTEAVEKEYVTLTSDPSVPSSFAPAQEVSRLDYYTANGQLYLNNLQAGDAVTVYSLPGYVVASEIAAGSTLSLATGKGMYIVKVNNTTAKVLVR